MNVQHRGRLTPSNAGVFWMTLILITLAIGGCGVSPSEKDAAISASRDAPVQLASAPGDGGSAQSSDLRQSSQGGNVTVEVTWQRSAATASAPVTFLVVMDTHSVDLDGFDLSKLTVLRNDSGQELAPQTWDAPAGGHHRSGTLAFPVAPGGEALIGPQSKFIELVVRDVAGVKERSFRWEVSS